MPRLPGGCSQEQLRRGMIAFFETYPQATMLEVSQHFNISRITAQTHFRKLQEEGFVLRGVRVLKPALPVEWLVMVVPTAQAPSDPARFVKGIKNAVLRDVRFTATVAFDGAHQAHSGCFVRDRMVDGYTIRLRTLDLETGAELGKFTRFVPGIAHLFFIHLHPVVGPCMEGGGDDK